MSKKCSICGAFDECDGDGICLICYAWKDREVEGQFEWRQAIANHVARVFSEERESNRIFSIGFAVGDEALASPIGLMTVERALFAVRLMSRDEMVARLALGSPLVHPADVQPIGKEQRAGIRISKIALADRIAGDVFASLLAHPYGRTVWPWLRYRAAHSEELLAFAVRLCVELSRRSCDMASMFNAWSEIRGERFFQPVAAEFRRLQLRLENNPPTVLVLD